MPAFTIETALCVDTYYDGTDPDYDVEEAFKEAANDYEGARLSAGEDMIEYLTDEQMKGIKITSIAWIEFDSSNISHAVSYFEVHCEAPQDVIDALTGDDRLIPSEEED
jgi:hypothetical protein